MASCKRTLMPGMKLAIFEKSGPDTICVWRPRPLP